MKPIVDMRLRYDHIGQDNFPDDAEGLTMRVRPGIAVQRSGLSAIVEGEATVGVVRRFDDGFNHLTSRPLIADADNIEINRLQLGYQGPAGGITIGRQLLELADQRFVGSASFRQNQQTFDAVSARWMPLSGLSADFTYAWSVRTVIGRKGEGARPRSVRGDNVFALMGYATPVGKLTGFAYIVDQNMQQVQNYRLASQSYGVRFTGKRLFPRSTQLSYALSYARQSDYHRNPNSYTSEYYAAELALSGKVLAGTVGYEILGAADGRAFTSFQTPDASAFRFQGWSGRFITTPADGIRDLYMTVAPTWKTGGVVSGLGAGVTIHRFWSDRLIRRYGDEFDLLATVKIERFTLSARYARYRADLFGSDVHRFWLSTEWVL